MADSEAVATEAGVKMVLVTGASGYIAAHVTQQLLRAGYRVRGTVRSLENPAKVEPLRQLCPDAKHKLELVEADLLKPESWKSAVEGCSHVLHIASPFPSTNPRDENELIKPAVEGTLNVLRACQEAGTVKRVVLTSSVAAVSGGAGLQPNHTYSEADWPDLTVIGPYEKSKTLAEKAAWDFMENLKEEEKFELAVVNPGFVMGPVLSGSSCTSMELPKKLLLKEMPVLAKLSFGFVDVRDVAAAHIVAMTKPEAVGNRHLLISGSLWMKEVALVLQKEFKSQGYNIPTFVAPKIGVQIFSLFDATVRMIVPFIGKMTLYDNSRMTKVLGIEPRKMEDTLIDMCYSMIEGGFLPKKAKYRGPKKETGEASGIASAATGNEAANEGASTAVSGSDTKNDGVAVNDGAKDEAAAATDAINTAKETTAEETKEEDKTQSDVAPVKDDPKE